MTDLRTLGHAGLLTREHAPVPLAGVVIDAEITGLCARVVVTHRYVNAEDKPIEAIYVFPLDEGAAVSGFEAIVDGTLVVGEVRDRDEAFEMYDDAMAEGHGAFLLDEERPDVFQASIGNLRPGKEVLVRLTYVTELTVAGDSLRFALPTTISPRYAPNEDRTAIGRSDMEALNPPVAWRVPYGLNLSIRLAMQGAISQIESPSHPITVSVNGNAATVSLAQRDTALDQDFVLAVQADGLEEPQAWVERDSDGGEAIAIAFAPRLPERQVPAEVVFLVDRSGSMQGTSIEEVRNALQLCLRSMIAGCRFNIVGFGTSYQTLFDASRQYDDASLADASAHVAGLQADLGGTELLPALKYTLKLPVIAGLARQVVVLTDGEVTNTDDVIALAREHESDARIFTFGIGAGASHHLVKGLARAARGTSEMIFPGERIEPKVVRQFGRLLSPSLNNVRVDWGGLDVTQAPAKLPAVLQGMRLLLYGFLKQPIGSSKVVTRLAAESSSGPIVFDVPIDPSRVTVGRTVATLAARARIRELEESPEWIMARGSRQGRRKRSAAAQEIITLGVKYGLTSRETSYVAIERRNTPVAERAELRRIPVALTRGWGGIKHGLPMPAAASLRVGSVPPVDQFFSRLTRSLTLGWSDPERRASGRPQVPSVPLSWTTESSPARPSLRPASAPPPAMHALISLQGADGTWDLTSDLADILGMKPNEVESALDGAAGNRERLKRAWATALAIAWLRTYAREFEDEWNMLASKARRWLDDVDVVAPGGRAWVDAAAAFLHSSCGSSARA